MVSSPDRVDPDRKASLPMEFPPIHDSHQAFARRRRRMRAMPRWAARRWARTPANLRGMLLVALIAASMSTFDSTVNKTAGFFTRDLYQKYMRPACFSWERRFSISDVPQK